MYNGIYKNNGIKSFAAMWRDSEIIILNEVSHTEQYKYITYMWNLKIMIQMNLLIKQKQIHRHGKQSYGCQREIRGRDKSGV